MMSDQQPMHLVISRDEVREYVAARLDEWEEELGKKLRDKFLDEMVDAVWYGIYEGGDWLERAVATEVNDSVDYHFNLKRKKAANDQTSADA